jgi:hypothetical protein
MSRRHPPRKVTYFEPVQPRLARNTIIETTFDVGRRFRCTMRVDCGELDPDLVIRPVSGEWHSYMPERLNDEELADWRRNWSARPACVILADFLGNCAIEFAICPLMLEKCVFRYFGPTP